MTMPTEALSAATLQMGPKAPAVGRHMDKAQAMATAREFESLFLAQFSQVMLESVKSDGPFGGGPSEDIYKSLMAQEYGKALAKSGSFGIADSVYREIIKSQEV